MPIRRRRRSSASTTTATHTNPVCPQANDAMFKLLVLALITATDMVQFNAFLLYPHFNLAVSWCAVRRLAFAVEARCTSCRTAVPLRCALRAGLHLPWTLLQTAHLASICRACQTDSVLSPSFFPLPPSLQVAHRKLLDALSVCEQRPDAFHAEVVQPLIERAEAGRRLEGAVAFASTGLSAFEVKVMDVLDEDVAPQVGQGAGELVPGHAWSACFAPPPAGEPQSYNCCARAPAPPCRWRTWREKGQPSCSTSSTSWATMPTSGLTPSSARKAACPVSSLLRGILRCPAALASKSGSDGTG